MEWARRFTPSPRRGEGGVRGLRRFRIALPKPPHPTFSNRSRIYPTSAIYNGEVGQARLRVGRRSERQCVPKDANAIDRWRCLSSLAVEVRDREGEVAGAVDTARFSNRSEFRIRCLPEGGSNSVSHMVLNAIFVEIAMPHIAAPAASCLPARRARISPDR